MQQCSVYFLTSNHSKQMGEMAGLSGLNFQEKRHDYRMTIDGEIEIFPEGRLDIHLKACIVTGRQ